MILHDSPPLVISATPPNGYSFESGSSSLYAIEECKLVRKCGALVFLHFFILSWKGPFCERCQHIFVSASPIMSALLAPIYCSIAIFFVLLFFMGMPPIFANKIFIDKLASPFSFFFPRHGI